MIENPADMSAYAPGGAKYGKVCEHGRVERACDECWNAALVRALECELSRRHDYDAVVNALKATTTAKAIKDKMVKRAEAILLAALGLHPRGQCTGEECGCECLCVEELAGMAAKALAEYKKVTAAIEGSKA